MIGGEESGGYAFRNHVPERDGILAGLYLLDLVVKTGKKPSELLDWLFEKVGPHYYDRVDVRFEQKCKQEILANVADARPRTVGGFGCTDISNTDGYQFMLDDGGWLLIRFSGTEPVIRVYCETTDENRVQSILNDGLRIAGLK